jgi:catechol 2,3-dioxygenase-like lactoylglutathione lyase family enzyme
MVLARCSLAVLVVAAAVGCACAGAGRPGGGRSLPTPPRPLITGIAGVSIWVTDAAKSVDFYSRILGLRAAPAPSGGAVVSRFPVNDRQRVELRAAGPTPPANLLAEVAFATSDAAQMRAYLLARGQSAGPIEAEPDGVRRFELADPEGHRIAFVEDRAAPGGFRAAPEQVSARILHAGFIVHDRSALDRFYRDLLGFRMYWHGGMTDTGTDWVEIQVPDGSDWVEYMLNVPLDAGHEDVGVMNHFSLGVDAIQGAAERLRAHGYRTDDRPEIGRDGKWQFDIFDPDGTRVEFMERVPARPPCCHPYEAAHPNG